MSDVSKNSIEIEASLEDAQALLFDPESYPSWSSSTPKSKVLERDEEGRARKVEMEIKAGPVRDVVTLSYDWSDAPKSLHFTLDDGDMLTEMSGSYELSDSGDASITVSYSLTVGLTMPVPEMMRTKAERETIDKALNELKSKLEA